MEAEFCTKPLLMVSLKLQEFGFCEPAPALSPPCSICSGGISDLRAGRRKPGRRTRPVGNNLKVPRHIILKKGKTAYQIPGNINWILYALIRQYCHDLLFSSFCVLETSRDPFLQSLERTRFPLLWLTYGHLLQVGSILRPSVQCVSIFAAVGSPFLDLVGAPGETECWRESKFHVTLLALRACKPSSHLCFSCARLHGHSEPNHRLVGPWSPYQLPFPSQTAHLKPGFTSSLHSLCPTQIIATQSTPAILSFHYMVLFRPSVLSS